ncbi:hypothetical protein GCM10016272_27230 [Psychrobacter glaciei]|uniref:Uncharacterized protein n=1 Tax=Psychrobacter glaciei TaxID=619771 RepID=A0ABQ3GVR3_9GAMM|nr:short-chain dehydrogenase [Psychrobacter glaciei]GHD38281.1 hypothetical protein GCM10016272_27230 [Psychrobacter glaciei]
MTLLKKLDYEDVNFEVYSSQQFATVVFDRGEDEESVLITVIENGKINQFEGNNRYNPSSRRISTCIYTREEAENEDGKVIKICIIQHKGTTLVEVHGVEQQELDYLFKKNK